MRRPSLGDDSAVLERAGSRQPADHGGINVVGPSNISLRFPRELAGDSEPAASWPRRYHREPTGRQELSRTIAQCFNLEQEIHHTASKLCILGFEPLK
jgi:hypothetical protein